ncbi:hypothetical protein ScPMuIL_001060 [Solemya velum]
MKRLNDKERLALHRWAYHSEDHGILSPFMTNIWLLLAQLVPSWVTPCAISTVGLFCNLVPSLLMLAYSCDAKQEVPPWLCVLAGVGLLLYQTMDALDGEQCHRIDRDTPLETLFDHGFDSVTTGLVFMNVCIVMKLGEMADVMFLLAVLSAVVMYSYNWYAYVTGVFVFGRIDVTETQFGVMAVFFLTALAGQDVWKSSLLKTAGYDIRYRELIVLAAMFLLACKLLSSMKTIYRHAESPVRKGNHIGIDAITPVVPLLAVLTIFCLCFLWIPEISQRYLAWFSVCLNLVVARLVCSSIISHTVNTTMPLYFKCIPVLLVYLMIQLSDMVGSLEALVFLAVFSVGDYVKYFYYMSCDICDSLKIKCFNVQPTYRKLSNAEDGVESVTAAKCLEITSKSVSEIDNLRDILTKWE